jgi:hypothetical protein
MDPNINIHRKSPCDAILAQGTICGNTEVLVDEWVEVHNHKAFINYTETCSICGNLLFGNNKKIKNYDDPLKYIEEMKRK